MHTLPSIKRELSLGIAVSALVFLCALAWGSPFIAIGPSASSAAQMQPVQAAQSTTFTGTIVRDGEQFLLRDSSGQIYRLDSSQHAQQFEGKAVKVTGRLDAAAKLIHVESIVSA